MKTRLRAELWDKLHYILSHSTDRMIRIELQYDGLIETETLRKALEHVTNSNPILHSAFRDHSLRPYWEVQPYSINDILTVIDILTSEENITADDNLKAGNTLTEDNILSVTEAEKAEVEEKAEEKAVKDVNEYRNAEMDMEAVTESDNPEQAKQRFMSQVIPVESNVQYKVAVINYRDRSQLCTRSLLCIRSQLCMIINHMCVDGRGSQILLNQIAATYSKIHKNLPVPEIKSGSRAHAKIYSGFSLFNRLVARLLLKNITRLKEKRTFAYTPEDPSDDLLMVTAKWTADEFSKIRETLKNRETAKWTAEEPTAIREFSKIKQTAKKTGATVNDVLLAFYTHALYQTCNFPKEKPLTITCMVDNRRYIRETEATGLTNHVGLMQVRMDRCGSTVGETAAKIAKATALEKKKRFFGLSGIPLIRLGYHLPFFLAKPGTKLWFLNPVLGFSNLGVIQEELFHLAGLKVVESLFVGPQQYKPYLTVYIHMMCDALYFTTAVKGNHQDRQKIMHLFDAMKQNMREFVNGQHL